MKLKLHFIPLLLAVMLLVGCASNDVGGAVVYVNEDNFEAEVIQSDKLVLLDFYAEWCGPCKVMSPILEEIAAENPDIKVCKIDVDEEPELSARFNIEAMPTFIVIKDGEVVRRVLGARSKEDMLELLK